MKVNQTISVIGIGKLGLPVATCFAKAGFNVVGVDIDSEKINSLKNNQFKTVESDVNRFLKENQKSIQFTCDFTEATSKTCLSFLFLPTPLTSNGELSTEYIQDAIKRISVSLKEKNRFHAITICSTIMPGAMQEIKSLLETETGKRVGVELGLAYNPEFVAIGKVIYDFLNPDFVLIGELDKKTGNLLEELYKRVCRNNPAIIRTTPINAEIAKVCLNSYIATKITFANMISEICEKVNGADADIVTSLIGKDRRIGKLYFKPGLGYGGPCFSINNRALIALAEKIGFSPKFVKTVEEMNNRQVSRIIERIKKNVPPHAVVSILGLAFKRDTSLVIGSQAVDIALMAVKQGYIVKVYDPYAADEAKQLLGKNVSYCDNLGECLQGVSLAVIATPCEEFHYIQPELVLDKMKSPAIFDCWGILKENNIEGINYVRIGKK